MAILKTLEPSCQLFCSFPWILLIIVRVKYTSWDRRSRGPMVCMRATMCVCIWKGEKLFIYVCMHSHALAQHVYLWIYAFSYQPGTWRAYWWMTLFQSYLRKRLVKLKKKILLSSFMKVVNLWISFWLTFPCVSYPKIYNFCFYSKNIQWCQILSRYFHIILHEKDKDSSDTVLNLTSF